MTKFFHRLYRARLPAALAAMLAAVLLAVCADPTPLTTSPEEESIVVVRGPEGYHEVVENNSPWATLQAAAGMFGGSYECYGMEDCWRKCPEPQLDGGTTVCSCRKMDEGADEEDPNDDRWVCTINHYGPGENPAGGGGCGEGGGEGIGDDDLADCSGPPNLELTCTSPVTRGEDASCTVSVSGYRRDSLTYEWNSGVAAIKGLGIWWWDGSATSTRTISVEVISGAISLFKDSRQVVVEARSTGEYGWYFKPMTHDHYTYGLPSTAEEKAWGAYGEELQYEDGAGAVREGKGPWGGEYYTYLPHRLVGRMFLHSDFDTSGVEHHSAHNTCPGQGIPASANVLTVNTLCSEQHKKNLKEVWEPRVVAHEQLHEDGANKCLASGIAAEAVLARMEKLTGPDAGIVKRNFDAAFDGFRFGAFRVALETTALTPLSPVIWEWRDNDAWTEQQLRPFQHNGTDGC